MASTGKRPAVQANEQEWRRLGELLQLRRSELGYQFRPAFVEARGINIRRVSDIENNYRPNTFPPGSLREIAQAYQVTYDSIVALLRGEADELIPAEPALPPVPSAPTAAVSDSGATPMVTGEDNVTASWSYAEPIWERLYHLARAATSTPRAPICSARAPMTPAPGMTRACGSYGPSASGCGTSPISAAARPEPGTLR